MILILAGIALTVADFRAQYVSWRRSLVYEERRLNSLRELHVVWHNRTAPVSEAAETTVEAAETAESVQVKRLPQDS